MIESVLLQAELLDLKTDYDLKANGVVMESKIDVGRGPIVNIIVTSGTLKKGDYFVSGLQWGKIRALINDQGLNINQAIPSLPVEVLGITLVSGNVPLQQGILNTLYTAELCEVPVNVYAGADKPLKRNYIEEYTLKDFSARVRTLSPDSVSGQCVHGVDGMGDIGIKDQPASVFEKKQIA